MRPMGISAARFPIRRDPPDHTPVPDIALPTVAVPTQREFS